MNGLFLLLRAIIFRSSFSRGTLLKYIIFASPAAVIEFFFERNSRPQYVGNELKTGGEDLDAKGLTEYMWDVLYWTWINTGLVALFGDRLWWAMVRSRDSSVGEVQKLMRCVARCTCLLCMASVYYIWKCSTRSWSWRHGASC